MNGRILRTVIGAWLMLSDPERRDERGGSSSGTIETLLLIALAIAVVAHRRDRDQGLRVEPPALTGSVQPVRARRGRNEIGGSNTVAAVLLVPVMMLAILGTLQVGIWYHGRQTALRAAQSAVEAGTGAAAGGPAPERSRRSLSGDKGAWSTPRFR